jgi:type IV secretory pathway TraG/TraD family ATPase VirD4
MRLRTIILFFGVGMVVMFLFLRSHGGASYTPQNASADPSSASRIEHGLWVALNGTVGFLAWIGHFTNKITPAVDRVLWVVFGPVLKAAFFLFMLPGIYATVLVWDRWLQLPSPTMADPVAVPFALTMFGISWVFWRYLFPLGLDVIGLYNPFFRSGGGSRLLRLFVRVREWWEISFKAGRQAIGGWADRAEMMASRHREGNIYLGRPSLMKRPVGMETDRHMVTIAAPGSGKSVGAMVPNLCLHTGSLLCIDVKGELAALTAARRGKVTGVGVRGMGQRVHVVDPFNQPLLGNLGMPKAHYNVFDEMAAAAKRDPNIPVQYAEKLAQAIVEVNPASHDPYFDQASRSFVRALILYVFTHEKPERRNLVRLRELITVGDAEGRQEEIARGNLKADSRADEFGVLVSRMIAVQGQPYDGQIRALMTPITRMPEKQRGSVISVAQEHTSFMDLPEMQAISQRSDFLLQDLANGWTSIYLCLPLGALMGSGAKWLRIFIMLTLDIMERIMKPREPPILMAIDEFPNIGVIAGIEKAAATLRSRGVRLWLVGQNLGQFEAVYPDTWKGLVGDAGAIQFMNIGDPSTSAFLMERLGEHVVVKKRRVQGGYQEYEERPVNDAAELGRILAKNHKNQIIWRSDRRPMKLKITPYYDYMPFWMYDKDPRFREKFKRGFWRAIFR